jgi:hypothetical protein
MRDDARQLLERLGVSEGDRARDRSEARRVFEIEIGRLRFSSTRSATFPDAGIEVVSADPRDLFMYRLLDELLAQSGPVTAHCRKCGRVFWKVGKRTFCSDRCKWAETQRRLRREESEWRRAHGQARSSLGLDGKG